MTTFVIKKKNHVTSLWRIDLDRDIGCGWDGKDLEEKFGRQL